jgi:diacylglycerol kinase (ATP)
MRTLIRRTPRTRPGTRAARAAKPGPIQIVVTPGSGNGRALSTALRLRDALVRRRLRTRLEVFPDLDSLHRWTKTDGEPFSTLVCVGGDGTQSTAALAALRRSVPFLPVSSGFGNLFANAFNHRSSVEGALDLLARGQVIHSDVGRCNGEVFLCQQSYGLIADVQEAVEAAAVPRARWQRWLAYYRAALRYLREAPPTRLRVVVDGRVVAVDAALVIVANVKTYGRWLPLTPDTSPVDGLFDVFVMRGASHRQVFLKLLRRHLGIPGPESGTLLGRGQRVTVSGLRSLRDRLEVLPHRLPVIVSPATAAALERNLGRRQAQVPPAPGRVAWGTRQSARVGARATRSFPAARMAPMAARTASPMAIHTA